MRCRRQGFRQCTRERGQGTVEYIGVALVFAVALAVGLQLSGALTPFFEGATERGMARSLCILFGDTECEEESGTTDGGNVDSPDVYAGPDWQDPSRTPLERATWGDYAALGDSYTSGEGGSEFEEGTDDLDFGCDLSWSGVDCGTGPEKNTCHRSTNAYGPRVSRDIDFEGDYTGAACSGAVIDDFTEPVDDQHGERAQLDHLDEDTSLVTLSVGGNDAGFGDVVSACVLAGVNPADHCSDDRDQTMEDIDAIGDDLTELLEDARERAPNARIVVVGYPRLFPDPPFDGDGNLDVDSVDQQFLNDAARRLNDVMQQSVDDAGGTGNGIEFVDAYDAFEGCELGTDDSCMNGFKLGTIDGKPPVSAGSYHPNDRGHERLAELVERQIREGQ